MKHFAILLTTLCVILSFSTAAIATASQQEFTINGVTVTPSSGTAVNNCATYAGQILSKIWHYKGVTTTFDSQYNMLRYKSAEEREITEEHVKAYIQNAPLGSRIRISHYSSTTTDNYDDNENGHTMVLVAKDNTAGTFTTLEAGWGKAEARTYTYSSFSQKWRSYDNSNGVVGYFYFFYIADLSSFGTANQAADATAASTLSINIHSSDYPSHLQQGSSFPLSGTVTSNYMITSFAGEIIDSNGNAVFSVSQTASTKNFSIRRSKVDMGLMFDKLAGGTYCLQYTATDSSGNTETWKSAFFTVSGPAAEAGAGETSRVTRTAQLNLRNMETTSNSAEGWSWDNETKTLTLDNVNFAVSDEPSALIVDSATIILKGTNTIKSTYNNTKGGYTSMGIYAVNGHLTFEGDGSLTAMGGTTNGSSIGIAAGLAGIGSITINSGSVTALGGTSTSSSSGGLQTSSLSINAGSLTAAGGTGSDGSRGVYIYGGTLNINGGALKASGGTVQGSSSLSGADAAVYAGQGGGIRLGANVTVIEPSDWSIAEIDSRNRAASILNASNTPARQVVIQ